MSFNLEDLAFQIIYENETNYITRQDTLTPAQPHKVTRAACSGHVYLMSCITFSALVKEGQMDLPYGRQEPR